jgi:hypothetical protein
VFDKIAEVRLSALGSRFLVRRYTHWLRYTGISAVVEEDVCPPGGQFYTTAEHVLGVIGESRWPKEIDETRRALYGMLTEFLGGPHAENLEKRLRVHLDGRIARWEGEANGKMSSLPPAEAAGVVRPSTADTVENAGPEPVLMNGGCLPVDPVAADRTALLTAFKAKARGQSIKVTDEMVAKAAKATWNERTMVGWWKRNHKECKPPHDRLIRAVLAKDPSSIWQRNIEPKRQPK